MTNAADLIGWMRAAGEPTRLRLLTLCAERKFSVSELALAVGQSGPRTSRHLKILCAAGLLDRLRCAQWVHYRLTQDAAAARFVRALVQDLDPGDPLLAPDRRRARTGGAAPGPDPDARSRLDQALAAFIAAGPAGEGARLGSTLIVGTQQQAMLAGVIRASSDCLAIAHSQRAARSASLYLRREGLTCRVLLAPGQDPIAAELAHSERRFGAVVLNRSSAHAAPLGAWLAAARPLLRPDGRLWLFERRESLGARADAPPTASHARLRQLLGEAGFECERLSPVLAGREAVLAAVAVPAAAVSAASVA
jgi:DNA-binding transcriptional ArsR family regulator